MYVVEYHPLAAGEVIEAAQFSQQDGLGDTQINLLNR